MDWARLAGSVIAGLIGDFFDDDEDGGGGDDSDTPNVEFDFGPPVIQQEPVAPPPEPVQAPAPEPEPAPVAPPPQPMQMPALAPAPEQPKSNMATNWLSSMSPEAQKVLGQGVAGGVAGLMAALAAKNAQEDSREREERAREDRRRRGAVPDLSAAYSSREGIFNSRRG